MENFQAVVRKPSCIRCSLPSRVKPFSHPPEQALLGRKPPDLPPARFNSWSRHHALRTGNRLPGNFHDQLVKVDVHERASKTWFKPGCYPGEPVFVAAPNAHHEDEGIILSVVLDADKGASFLLVLDAGSIEELARAEVPHHIPFSLQGQYFEEGADRRRHLYK